MRVRAIAAGSEHCLALTTDGRVLSWGNAEPPPENLRDVTAIAAGTFVSLALLSDGSVVGWGATGVPDGLRDVTAIAAGGGMCFATQTDGTVVAWGKHFVHDAMSAIEWQASSPPSVVSKSGGFALSIDANGAVSRQKLGDFMMGAVPDPPPGASRSVASVGAGFAHGLAVLEDRSVLTWAEQDQLRDANLTPPTNLKDVVAVAGGGAFSLALRADGQVVGWGQNEFGQTDIPDGLGDVAAIAAGTHFAVALTTAGKVAAWGRKQVGQTSVPSVIADSLAMAATKRPLGPITLNKEALPKALILKGSPDEDQETSLSRLPDDASLIGTIEQMSRLVDAQGFQYEARRSVACSYNNFAARQIAIGDNEDVQAAIGALFRADETLDAIPYGADGIPRDFETRLIIPVARAVLRINLALALHRSGDVARGEPLLREARRLITQAEADPLASRGSDSEHAKRVQMVLSILRQVEAQTMAATSAVASRRPQPESSTDTKSSGGCYIATAVYGSYDAAEVLVLRQFRDECLNTTAPGRTLVRIYYALSPRVAGAFRDRPSVNRTAKRVLDRIVRRLQARYPVQEHKRRTRPCELESGGSLLSRVAEQEMTSTHFAGTDALTETGSTRRAQIE